MRGAAPVTTRPFLPSSSPVRHPTSAARTGRQRQHLRKNANPNANYYGILADEDEDEVVDTLDALDLEFETRKIIAKEKERMTTRADVLRTFAESIAACARKFDHGYAHAVANDFTKSLLHHWNQFLHSGDTAVRNKPAAARPPTDNQLPRPKTVSFADVTQAASRQAPGDVHIAPARRQPIAASNYADRRILLRLKEGSSFFEKKPFQIRTAIFEKLTLGANDVQNITKTNTGWSVVARNKEIQKKILESQEQWGPNVDLTIAEKQVTWFTYLIQDFPNELRSYDETILDFNATISEEIVAQTGQTPVWWRRSVKPSSDPTKTPLVISFEKPVRGTLRLLGLGAFSFLMTKPQRLVQCQNCWQFHPNVPCTATKTCRTCGVSHTEHDTENCQATPRCTNCEGPHHADFGQCYARPKKVGDTFHKLSKSQRTHARKLGADDYRRQNMEMMAQSLDNPLAPNEATTNTTTNEVDAEMADTAEGNATTTPEEDCLPALGEDEDMGDTEQEQLQSNEGILEENAESGKAVEVPDSQEQLEGGGNDAENTAEHEATEEGPEDESDNSENENDEDNSGDDDEAAPTQQNRQQEPPAAYRRNILRTTPIHRMGVSEIKAPRVQLSSRPTPQTLLVMLRQNKRSSFEHYHVTLPRAARHGKLDDEKNRHRNDEQEPGLQMSNQRRHNAQPVTIKFFQANVDKGKEAHSAALQLAFLEGYNVVILQEPNTSYNKQKKLCRTQYHPGFLCFSPVDFWHNNDTRPRVMTYVKIDRKIQAEQITPAKHRDLLWVRVSGITILNLYNRPEVDSTLQVLEDWTPPENCIVAGDMNALHTSWQADRPASQDGNRIHAWTERHDLDLLNEPDEATTMAKRYTQEAAQLTCFSNIPEASATVEVHLMTGSLHYTIGIEIPDREPAQVTRGNVRVATPDEIKAFGDHVGKAVESLPTDVDSPAQIEGMARQLQKILQNSAKACDRVSRDRRARGCPWWNQECKDAHDDLRITRRIYENQRGEEVQRSRVKFCRVLRRTRQKFWRNTINEVTSAEGVYKLTRWMKPRQRLQPPPIQVGNMTYSTDAEKAMAPRKEKLERRDSSDDIADGWQPAVRPPKEIPFARTISTNEVEKAVLHTGNTTPGSDGITTRMLQAAWPHIARPVTKLYNACLRLGHHPSVFKTAEIVMIPKLNKRNLSDVSTWRPISLLSCLSKRLERVIARRMAYAAIKYGILHPNQAGALPKRPAVDIVVSLIYDIEKALAAGQVATLVTEDVMGAFDAILRNRMILCLRQQGWPDFLIRWIASFLLDRLASVRFQDATTPSARLRCGLPQGSSISPILYILITAAIYFLSGAAQRYGYADDTAMLFIGDSLEDTTRQANEAIAAMESWGRGEAIHFDPEKTEVMHFSRRKAGHDQSPVIYHGDKEIQATPSMRWLGIWLDKKLTFNHHIDEWTKKARRVVNHLRGMNNTVRGMAATAARRAAWAVAMPTLFHGLDAWLPGLDAPTNLVPHHQIERPRLIPQRFSDNVQVEGPGERLTKEKAVPYFEQWLAGRPAGYVVFSDGSKTDKDTAGYGFAVFRHGRLLDWDYGQLGRREVFDAEIHGALAGLKAAMQRNSRLEPITVCMDNTSVIDCIGATAADSSQACFREFQKIGDRHPYLISVKWSPGHTGIFGNELADQLAKHGATPPTDEHLPSVSYRKRQMKKQIAVDHRAWWASVERTEYLKLGLSAELKKLPELSLPRRMLDLLTARSQHNTATLRNTTRDSTQDRRHWSALAGARSRLPTFSTAGRSLVISGFGWTPTQRRQ
ncbi:reverse transcriptase [Akanthomyces lecanii RCEF 1005]|uniref:Reverse transcriptase n=1 Tax=Akanthomyces lecanii RCEF 1005 TaxID=1081108 RepID=A0A167QPV8_CORDF|nr:reverse transcriptase [Akanthomyces lecanii RCEF 1005]